MNQYRNPSWWKNEYDTAWERVKAAFRHELDQPQHEFGGDEPEPNQGKADRATAAMGSRPVPPRGASTTIEEAEPAYRFGYGARQHFGERFPDWDARLESQLKEEWRKTYPDKADAWTGIRPAVRRGWEYQDSGEHAATSQAFAGEEEEEEEES